MKTVFNSMLIVLMLVSPLFAQGNYQKPRIINTTDLGADPDDQQSMVRFLACANEFDTEGLIVATGCWKTTQSSTSMLDKIVNAYEKVYDNLAVHADGYPTPEYLKSISILGQRGYGMNAVGERKDSPGSELIIVSVDKDDPRPVWVTGWGGINNVAQAIWKVQNTRTPEELDEFISKLRVFDILGQDDAGAWLTKNFPELFYIRATGVYGWAPSDSWIAANIQNHGALGAEYPDRKYATEGDTPCFMHVYPNGLNDPEQIDQGGWGGRFSFTKKANLRGMSQVAKISDETQYDPYYMYTNTSEGASAISRWKPAYDNDFAARMDWSMTDDYASVNHHPFAVVNGDSTRDVLEVSAAPGSNVNLSALGSSDPDGDSLIYRWSFYKEPGTPIRSLKISNSSTATPTVEIPENTENAKFHIILALRDTGSPNLYAYRRVIINVNLEDTEPRWVGTWSTAPYAAGNNTPPAPYLANNTLRQIIRTSIGGDTLRIKFSNRTCSTPVTMNSVNIAVSDDAGTSVIDASTIKQLTFDGDTSVTMNAYSEVTSDPFVFPLTPGMRLAITTYYGQCSNNSDMTFHYGSRTDSYILAGSQTTSVDFSGATTVERWYHLSAIDVVAPVKSASVAVMGNSITDGYGLHGGPNNRWTHFFSDKLLQNPSTSHVSVLNLGIGATSVTTSGVSRFQQDVLAQSGLRWIIIFYGVNDIGANKSANAVINAFKTLISQAHAQNIRIYGATITPFKGHGYYSAARESVRKEVNEWIRNPGNFDRCIDFDKAIRDESDPEKMQAAYSNDWLHPSAAGYQMLGEFVDLNLFLGADTLYEQPDSSETESHYFESECGSVGSNWDIIQEASVSNGAYITVKPGMQSLNSAATGGSSVIDFPFTIETGNLYYLYARINCPTPDDDSFWIKMDDGGFEMHNSLGTSGWQWMQLQSFDLAEGGHTLSVTYREDGAMLDKLCISSSLDAPIGMGEEAENLCDPTAVGNLENQSSDFYLGCNYPNPFNPTTRIDYSIPHRSNITLGVYNLIGQEVATLFNGVHEPGHFSLSFDGSDLTGGIYMYQLKSLDYMETKKFILLK